MGRDNLSGYIDYTGDANFGEACGSPQSINVAFTSQH